MKILFSSCLTGQKVMYNGGDFLKKYYRDIIKNPKFEIVHFCPEHIVLGTPRNNMLIHGGNGFDVWKENAKVICTDNIDLTASVKEGALKMLDFAQKENPDLIILTDGSDSCGTSVILDPEEKDKNNRYQFKKGPGVAAALLIENGFKVIGHNDVDEISNFLNIPRCTDFD